ncbi:MAG TPA: B12-binding domain-containing radical SAM protein [bacterium]|nr:B12-binding domain-containing radical SAM protein [bacterium]
MVRRKVLLLNPPGTQIFIRDYYCSKVSKARYLYHPVDLLMLSGTIAAQHDVRVLDGMLDGWTAHEVMRAIRSFQPDVIVFLTGVVSYIEDLKFIHELKRMHPFVSVASGELFLENGPEMLRKIPDVDAAILDFTDRGILELIDRVSTPGALDAGPEIPNIIYRTGDTVIGSEIRIGHGEEFELAIPRHDLFPNDRYRYPFVRRFPFATVLTDFGCPFKCDFCAINRLGFKKRKVENVLEELDLVKAMGFKDIYFDDQTFGADRRRTEQLLDAMIEREYRLGFICFTRADVVDREMLRRMRRAGCHTVVFGVEAVGDEALKCAKKDLTIERVRNAVGWCRTLGIRTVGTFIVGLPGMTADDAAGVGDFAVDLGLDFASFNVPAPRPGTGLRRQALENGWIEEELAEMDQSGSYAVMGNEYMTAEQVGYYRNQASRRFYFRFGYVFRRLTGIRTWYEFKSHVQEGIDLLTPSRFVRRH